MTDTLVEELKAALGSRGVLTSPEDRVRFEAGWRYGKGFARCIARPASTEEVARVLNVCASHGARVIAQGSNTGLVGASTPDPSGSMVVLSCERLNRTIEVDVHARTVMVDGGVLLSQLNEALAEHGFWFSVDLGDGRVVSMLNRLRKNNTGLDAKHLFCGTTGVWGVVTKAVLQVEPKPTQRATALVGCRDGQTSTA